MLDDYLRVGFGVRGFFNRVVEFVLWQASRKQTTRFIFKLDFDDIKSTHFGVVSRANSNNLSFAPIQSRKNQLLTFLIGSLWQKDIAIAFLLFRQIFTLIADALFNQNAHHLLLRKWNFGLKEVILQKINIALCDSEIQPVIGYKLGLYIGHRNLPGGNFGLPVRQGFRRIKTCP